MIQTAKAKRQSPTAMPHAVRFAAVPLRRVAGVRGIVLIARLRREIHRLLARCKLNIFHWHLTDDQGWRTAIKRYPKLTGIASCRAGSQSGHDEASSDGITYRGYYTQAQIRDVVAYAKRTRPNTCCSRACLPSPS